MVMKKKKKKKKKKKDCFIDTKNNLHCDVYLTTRFPCHYHAVGPCLLWGLMAEISRWSQVFKYVCIGAFFLR
jgi:hypothetical protein